MKISTLMKHDPATIGEDANLYAAAKLMWERDCGAIPVVDDDGRLHGMVTDRDIAMAAFMVATGTEMTHVPYRGGGAGVGLGWRRERR